MASRVLSSSSVSDGLIPAADPPSPGAGTLAELVQKLAVCVSERSRVLAPQLDEAQAERCVLRMFS